MNDAGDGAILATIGDYLGGDALIAYCALIALFIIVEIALVKQPERPRARAGKRHFVNFALLMLGIGLIALFPLGTAAAALAAQELGWGLFNAVEAHPAIVLLGALASHTFLGYWMHRALHAVPFLWRLHRVHHTDPTPDLSTGLRHHPVEVLATAPVYYTGVIALGLPIWAALLADFILLGGALFKHLDGNLPPGLERFFAPVIATPAIHRVHHSSRPVETDSNFGNLFIVWDRLFGTFTQPRREGPKRTGLGEAHDAISDNLAWQLRLALHEPPKTAPIVGGNSQSPVETSDIASVETENSA